MALEQSIDGSLFKWSGLRMLAATYENEAGNSPVAGCRNALPQLDHCCPDLPVSDLDQQVGAGKTEHLLLADVEL